MAIDVNGVTRTDIKVKSIDTQKGFIQLDTNLDPTDEIEVTFFMSPSGNFLIQNLELNPKVTGTDVADFHISGYPDGFGIAVRPYSDSVSGWYPYIYDLSEPEATRTLQNIYKFGRVYESVTPNWTDDDFVTVCEVDLNRLSSEIVTLVDARTAGGGVMMDRELREWFKLNYSGGIQEHEKDWYTDYGYFGGAPLSNSSIIVIHIPNEVLETLENRWIDYYTTEMNDPTEARDRAYKEYKHNLDQTIRRHISAGTEYIIVPTISGQFTGKILDLRQ
jgi:hypothetical protein